MTLMDAEQPDLKRERRRTILIISGIVLILFLAWLGYHERNYGQRHAVDKFFAAIQNKQYQQAYAIWKNPQYAYNDFYTDWGPGGEWGLTSPPAAARGLEMMTHDGTPTPRNPGLPRRL